MFIRIQSGVLLFFATVPVPHAIFGLAFMKGLYDQCLYSYNFLLLTVTHSMTSVSILCAGRFNALSMVDCPEDTGQFKGSMVPLLFYLGVISFGWESTDLLLNDFLGFMVIFLKALWSNFLYVFCASEEKWLTGGRWLLGYPASNSPEGVRDGIDLTD